MLKNSGNRLLTQAARNRAHAFPITYRAATGGSGPTRPFFQHPAKRVLIVAATPGYQTRPFIKAAAAIGLHISHLLQEQVALV